MVIANCRARFAASDFDFIVRVLAGAGSSSVTLVELLSDPEMRDLILDHERLRDAVLGGEGRLTISSALFFYVLVRRVLTEAGIQDRHLADYIASLLDQFSRTSRLSSPVDRLDSGLSYVSDLLIALQTASPSQTFLIRAHVGNYTLFLTGIFHDSVERRSQRGAPDFSFYEEMGRMSFHVAATTSQAKLCDLQNIYSQLGNQFHQIRLALNELSTRLLNLDDDHRIPKGLLNG